MADVIRYEHPQIQAIVVAYLDPDQAGEVLSHFDHKVRLDIVLRVSSLNTVQPAALKELNLILEKQFSGSTNTSRASLGGVKRAADIMNYLDSSIEGQLMDAIRDVDEDLSSQIEDLMFVFDNLAEVDDRGIQVLLREVSSDVLVMALKGADDGIKEKVFKNMSKRAGELLRDDLEAKGPVRVSDVENAQKEILTIARRMAEAGEIVLGFQGRRRDDLTRYEFHTWPRTTPATSYARKTSACSIAGRCPASTRRAKKTSCRQQGSWKSPPKSWREARTSRSRKSNR